MSRFPAALRNTAEMPAGPVAKKFFHYRRVTFERATLASKAGSVLRAAKICNIPEHYTYDYKALLIKKVLKHHKLRAKYWQRDDPPDVPCSGMAERERIWQKAFRECNGKEFSTATN